MYYVSYEEIKLNPIRIEPIHILVTSRRTFQYTIKENTFSLLYVLDKKGSLLHHKKLGPFPGRTRDNAQVKTGKYTGNCRENKTGAIPSYRWEKTVL